MTKLYCVLALCALLAASATAGTSFFGPSGLITMPTPDTLSLGEVQAFANYITRDDSNEAPVGVNVGLGFGIEVGATRVHETGAMGGDEVIINAKYVAFGGNMLLPKVAVGAINAAGNKDFLGSFIDTSEGEINPYIVAGKSINLPGGGSLSLSAGYIAGSLNKGMYGGSVSLTPNVQLMADYVPSWSALSIGARYHSNSGLGIQAAFIDGEFATGIMCTRSLWGK